MERNTIPMIPSIVQLIYCSIIHLTLTLQDDFCIGMGFAYNNQTAKDIVIIMTLDLFKDFVKLVRSSMIADMLRNSKAFAAGLVVNGRFATTIV